MHAISFSFPSILCINMHSATVFAVYFSEYFGKKDKKLGFCEEDLVSGFLGVSDWNFVYTFWFDDWETSSVFK